MPGGCNLGARPIDLHIKGFIALGAEVEVRNGFVVAHAPKQRLTGTHIYLDQASVGTTMNLILASAFASGTTIIENRSQGTPILWIWPTLSTPWAAISWRRTERH